jgi:3-deoxy-manno-octulosonate cytidylyltransferase (CMP-KDO synthetase)
MSSLQAIELLVCDVDGVLTDGRLRYGPDGELDKTFDVRDGHGIRRLVDAGIHVAFITARGGPAVERRARDLGVGHVLSGRRDKAVAIAEVAATLGIALPSVAYIGDDLLDLPAMSAVGLAIAPADARPEVLAAAAWITRAVGGHGAVREVSDAIFAARDALAFRVVIPSRMAATRLPGKPLRLLAGRPMIAHVWDRAKASGAAEVIVATEDAAIEEVVTGLGGRAVMTRSDHVSGSDRINEVAIKLGWADDAIVVNLQGDEPTMPTAAIRQVAELLAKTPGAQVATLATPITSPHELFTPDIVKVVLDDAGLARTFSRAPIPWARGIFVANTVPETLPPGIAFLRHLGIYAYRAAALRRLCATPPHPWERAESLEQLRALAIGMSIAVGVIDDGGGQGVDTEADLARAEALLGAR